MNISYTQHHYPPSHEAVGEGGLAAVGQTDDGYTQDSGVLWLVWFQQQFEILLSCLWKWDPCKTMNKTTTTKINCRRNCACKVSFSKQMCSFPETTVIYTHTVSVRVCYIRWWLIFVTISKTKVKRFRRFKMKIYVAHDGLYLLQYEKQK